MMAIQFYAYEEQILINKTMESLSNQPPNSLISWISVHDVTLNCWETLTLQPALFPVAPRS